MLLHPNYTGHVSAGDRLNVSSKVADRVPKTSYMVSKDLKTNRNIISIIDKSNKQQESFAAAATKRPSTTPIPSTKYENPYIDTKNNQSIYGLSFATEHKDASFYARPSTTVIAAQRRTVPNPNPQSIVKYRTLNRADFHGIVDNVNCDENNENMLPAAVSDPAYMRDCKSKNKFEDTRSKTAHERATLGKGFIQKSGYQMDFNGNPRDRFYTKERMIGTRNELQQSSVKLGNTSDQRNKSIVKIHEDIGLKLKNIATTRDLNTGTLKTADHVPGYTGHVPSHQDTLHGLKWDHGHSVERRSLKQQDVDVMRGYTGYMPNTGAQRDPAKMHEENSNTTYKASHQTLPVDKQAGDYNKTRATAKQFFTEGVVGKNDSAERYYALCRPLEGAPKLGLRGERSWITERDVKKCYIFGLSE